MAEERLQRRLLFDRRDRASGRPSERFGRARRCTIGADVIDMASAKSSRIDGNGRIRTTRMAIMPIASKSTISRELSRNKLPSER
jgi:hypothetical protein